MKYYLYLLNKALGLLRGNPRVLLQKLKSRLLNIQMVTKDHVATGIFQELGQIECTLIINSVTTGGSKTYLDNYIRQGSRSIILIESKNIFGQSWVTIYNKPDSSKTTIRVRRVLSKIVSLKISTIIVNHLLFTSSIQKTIDNILDLKKLQGANLEVVLHDYYYLCPGVNLLNYNNKFCGLPEISECNKCLHSFNHNSYGESYVKLSNVENIENWRDRFRLLFSNATKILVPSKYVANLFFKIYPNFINKVRVITQDLNYLKPLKENYFKVYHPATVPVLEWMVGILGEITYHKGASIVYDMLKKIQENFIPLKIVIIGDIIPYKKHKNLLVTGSYKLDDLPDIVNAYKINGFIIPSIWPETFCYVAEEVMQFDLPVFGFNLGAHAERIADYKFGHIVNELSSEEMLNCVITSLSKNIPIPR